MPNCTSRSRSSARASFPPCSLTTRSAGYLHMPNVRRAVSDWQPRQCGGGGAPAGELVDPVPESRLRDHNDVRAGDLLVLVQVAEQGDRLRAQNTQPCRRVSECRCGGRCRRCSAHREFDTCSVLPRPISSARMPFSPRWYDRINQFSPSTCGRGSGSVFTSPPRPRLQQLPRLLGAVVLRWRMAALS